MRRLLFSFFSLSFFFGVIVTAQAAPPDAGQILQEQMQAPRTLPQQLPAAEYQPAAQTDTENKMKITVSGFQFSGFAEVATEAELQELVSPAIGQTIRLAELKRLVAQVTNYLRNKGYLLAYAYLPKQEIIDGMVQVTVIVGQVEGTPNIRRSESARIKQQILEDLALSGAPSGEALQQKQLERSLLLMNDLPGISARSVLEKGDLPGTTQITIEAEEGPLVNGALSLDNFGNRYTGAFQVTAQAAANDLSGYGDQLALTLTGAEGLKKGQLYYSLPLGSSGLKSSLSYTGLSYELGKEFKPLDAEGSAHTLTANLRYPIIRSRAFSLWQGLQYEYRNLDDEAGGATTRERAVNVVSTNMSISQYDRFGGGGLTSASINLSLGNLELGVSADAANDTGTARTEGNYVKLTYSLSRLQRLAKDYTAFVSLSGQFASQNLDSSEKYLLGGPSGVRAYPVGEASGDEGFSLTSEFRFDLPQPVLANNLQLVTFFDAGRITLHDSPWTNSVATATGKNSYWLTGAGLGLNLDRPGKYAVRTSYAHPLGNNSGRSSTGKDADNKSNDHRFWLQAIIWF